MSIYRLSVLGICIPFLFSNMFRSAGGRNSLFYDVQNWSVTDAETPIRRFKLEQYKKIVGKAVCPLLKFVFLFHDLRKEKRALAPDYKTLLYSLGFMVRLSQCVAVKGRHHFIYTIKKSSPAISLWLCTI